MPQAAHELRRQQRHKRRPPPRRRQALVHVPFFVGGWGWGGGGCLCVCVCVVDGLGAPRAHNTPHSPHTTHPHNTLTCAERCRSSCSSSARTGGCSRTSRPSRGTRCGSAPTPRARRRPTRQSQSRRARTTTCRGTSRKSSACLVVGFGGVEGMLTAHATHATQPRNKQANANNTQTHARKTEPMMVIDTRRTGSGCDRYHGVASVVCGQ